MVFIDDEEGIYLKAPSWFVARAITGHDVRLSKFAGNYVAFEIRWAGSDAGVHPDKHLEIRHRLSERRWSTWHRWPS